MRRTLRILIAAFVIVAVAAAAAAYLLSPALDALREDAESRIARVSGRSISIGELEAGWRGWRPELRARAVRVHERRDDGEPGRLLASLDRLDMSLDPVASLLRAETRPRAIRLGHLTLHQRVRIDDLKRRLRAAAGWLLDLERVRIDVERIEVAHVRVADKPLTLLEVVLDLANDGDGHELSAGAALPGGQGERLRARATFTGNPLAPAAAGEVALVCEDMNVALLISSGLAPRLDAAAGRVSLDLRSTWGAGRLQRAGGTVRFRELTLRSGAGTMAPRSGETRLTVVDTATGWRARLAPQSGAGVYDDGSRANLEVHYAPRLGDTPAKLTGELEALDIAELHALLPLAVPAPRPLWNRVAALRPRGRVRDVAFSVAPGAGAFTLEGSFSGLRGEAVDELPAFVDLAGRFLVDERIARIDLSRGALGASLPSAYPEALAEARLRGRLLWSPAGGERRLALRGLVFSTADVEANVSGELRWKKPQSAPHVNLSMSLAGANLARLQRYVPAGLLGRGVTRWVKRAFPEGRLENAELELRGQPGREERIGNGMALTAIARVTRATLDYGKRWPPIRDVTADIRIDGASLTSTIHEGTVVGSRIETGHVLIPDMSAESPVLSVRGRVQGTTESAARYLRESPLARKMGLLVDHLEGQGEAALDLRVRIPLKGGKPWVSGRLAVVDNVFDVPGLEEDLTGVDGVFRFDTESIEAEDVTARYLGRPIGIAVETPEERPRRTRIHVSGTADEAYLARHLGNAGIVGVGPTHPVIAALHGETPWTATVLVTNRPEPGQEQVRIDVASEMEGVRIALPEPFAKDAGERLPVAVQTRIPGGGERHMRVTVGDRATAAFALRKTRGAFRTHRAAVRLGSGRPTLPAEPGLHVGGRLARFDLRDWSPILFGKREASRDDAAPASVDLAVDRLRMLGGEFDDVHVKAVRGAADEWVAVLRGTEIEGRVLIPGAGTGRSVVADFEGLRLRAARRGEAEPSTDPRLVPPIEFSCRRCSLMEVPLGLVKVETSPRADGVSIDSAYVLADAFEARARGTWTQDGERQRSEFDVTLSSGDLGELLGAFGYEGSATSGGATEVRFNASWRGPPAAFDLKDVQGRMEFTASEGTLVDVRRGPTGRVFGLLTVTTLPRRLKGDFSDLFEKGFTYERMEGSFNIIGGNAYTRDLTMESTTARIDIAGRTGLVDEDYDQYVTVTPKLTSSLPLAPIWLAEKVLQKQLFDKVFAYHYTITGSWDDPDIEQIRVEAEPADRS